MRAAALARPNHVVKRGFMVAIRVLAALPCLAPAPQQAADPPFFCGVGDLPGGAVMSAAYGVSGDGRVVVGSSQSASGEQAFRWSGSSGIAGLGDLPGGGTYSRALAVSADGSTVVGDSSSASGNEAFRWTPAGGMSGLGDLPGGGFFSIANAVSADGSVVVGHSASTASGTLGAEAFRWTAASGLAPLGDLPGSIFFSVATGVSADGSFVSGFGTSPASGPASSEAARWTAATSMVGLGDLPGGGFGSNAFAVSADGRVVVGLGAAAGGVYAFRWHDPTTGGAGMQSLGAIPGGAAFSRANGVSADGSVVVGQGTGPAGMEAFLWIQGQGMRSLKAYLVNDLGLDLAGWTLEVATAVSADGKTVVGYGPGPGGTYQGWVAHLGTPGAWTGLRHGLAGAAGVPTLGGAGTLAGAQPITLTLGGAAPSSAAALVIGLSQLDLPFFGGTFVPAPDFAFPLAVDAKGSAEFTALVPPGIPPATSLFFQAWILDPTGPAGLTASDALKATTP